MQLLVIIDIKMVSLLVPGCYVFIYDIIQIHTGLQHFVIVAPQPNGLPLSLPTLANCLRQQQYSTHIIGKWHLGFYKKEYTPTYRGFDSFYGELVSAWVNERASERVIE